jgi:hypothetical protein
MNRTHTLSRALLFTALAGVAVVGFAACGNDSKVNIGDNGGTLPPGVTLPAGVDIPGMDDCQQVYASYIMALTAAYTPNAQIDFDQTFGNVEEFLPADLDDDMAILLEAYGAYGAILAANNNDTSSPDVQAAIQALNTPEVTAATDNIQAYFEATCPGVT